MHPLPHFTLLYKFIRSTLTEKDAMKSSLVPAVTAAAAVVPAAVAAVVAAAVMEFKEVLFVE